MKYTDNYSLNKPEYTDHADINVLNDNMDTLDGVIKEQSVAIGNINTELGTTDISEIGDGTVKGGLSTLNSNMSSKVNFYKITSDNLDTIVTGENGYAIGLGTFDSTGYTSFSMGWIAMQFKVTSANVNVRYKYGGNSWSAWKTI